MASRSIIPALLALVFGVIQVCTAPTSTGFVVSIATSGTYSLSVNGKVWLINGATYFHADGHKYSSADGSLRLIQTSATSGKDKLGQWQDIEFLYHAGDNVVTATIKTYQNLNVVIFSQKYGNQVSGSSSGDKNSVSSAFPSFRIVNEAGELGYVSYGGNMIGGAACKVGQWTNSTALLNTGITGGPIILFDHDGNVIIQSPFNEFMASSVYLADGTVSWGIMGGVDNIPAMYESSTIIYYGNKGINQAMSDWGILMRFWYGRDQSFTNSDLTNNYLGFWTDNGAYYYYNTENNKTYQDTLVDVKTYADLMGAYYYYNTEKNKTYQDTLVDVKAYADQMGIPYKYVQYDSWWYPKGALGGVLTWDSMPSVFPNGMQYVYDKTGLPVSAHNRWWSSKTTYAKQNGGKYNFIVEKTKSIPQDKDFWTDLLRESKKWGLITYEQDWLDAEFAGLNATTTTVNVARDWLMQMGEGAAKNDITIQYCMANPRHALQTLEISVVTQARVSPDYHPGLTNWDIGLASIFADALGIRPFKDNFWTTVYQPGNHYLANETHPVLEAVVATLSTGPVGPGDMVQGSNASLIMRSCNTDGLLLQPSRPARSIDKNIIQKAFGNGSGPDGEVWSTYSAISGMVFGTILAPTQKPAVKVTPSDAGFGLNLPSSVIFKQTWPSPGSPANFSESNPLTIQDCEPADPCLWHSSPTIQVGGATVFFYGELQKWVPMSPKRVTNIDIADDLYVTVVGAVEEVIEFSFGSGGAGVMNTVTCNLGSSGSAVIRHLAKTCTPL